MQYAMEEVIKFIEEEDVKFIRLAFRDAYGVQKNISVQAQEVKKAFEEGAPFNAGKIAGFSGSEHAWLYLHPDASTMAILPWRPDSGRVLRMYCDVCTPEGKEFEADTRGMLKRAVKAAGEAGVSFMFGNETEFYLLKKDDEGNPTKIPYDQAGYMDIAPLDRCENVRREITLTIERMGLIPERSHHESGPGQNEVDFHYGKPLKAADQMTTFKMVVSTIADRYGLVADFSPVPLPELPGNGYHINIYAANDAGEDVGTYAAAGIIDKIRDMTLFLNPSEASYVRFGNNNAPYRVGWSAETSGELMYVGPYKGKTRVELRSPDASSNPYLVYTLLIHAGLLGIKQKLSLPKEGGRDGAWLPASRAEARERALDSDFIRQVIPKEIIDEYARGLK